MRNELAPKPLVRAIVALGLHVAGAAALLSNLRLDRLDAFLALALYFSVFSFVLSAIEAMAFSSEKGAIRPRDWVGGIGLAVVAAAAGSFLVPPGPGLRTVLPQWLGTRGTYPAVRDLGMCAIAFLVAYCGIGTCVWPFVRTYYQSPDSPLRLRVPRTRVILSLQLARGVLATLVLLPLIAALERPAAVSNLWAVAVTVATTSGLVPMLGVAQWPLRLRVVHGVELVVFAVVQSFVWWWFLAR